MFNVKFASELAWEKIESMNPDFTKVRELIGKAIHNESMDPDFTSFQQMYELIGTVVHNDWKAVPEKFILRLAVHSKRSHDFIDWLIDSGNATCKDPEARKQLAEIKARMEALHKRRWELEMNLGNIMRGEYSNIFLGIESDSLAYDSEHSEQFNDVKHLLWLCMEETESIECMGYVVEEEAPANPVYEMDMEKFEHIKKMFPDYIKQLMLPGVEEYEQVISELQSVIQKYDDAYTLTSITLSDGRTLEVGADWILGSRSSSF